MTVVLKLDFEISVVYFLAAFIGKIFSLSAVLTLKAVYSDISIDI